MTFGFLGDILHGTGSKYNAKPCTPNEFSNLYSENNEKMVVSTKESGGICGISLILFFLWQRRVMFCR